MNKAREFDNILDKCLERLLVNGEAIEQCLADYPRYAAELEPLLRTALTTKKVSAVKPRPEFRDRARYQFRLALQEMELRKERRFFFGWQPRWATVAITVLVLVLAGGGTVAAAENSMPDEPLYRVKLATETVRLTLTPSALGKAELYAKLADKRVTEIVYLAAKDKPEQVERAAERLNAYLTMVATLAAPVAEPPPEKEVTPFKALPPRAAAPEVPPGQAKDDNGGEAKDDNGGEAKDDKGAEAKDEKRAKLKEIMARNAANHPAVLREVLKKAPASVRQALRQAIADSEAGYEKALESLD